MIAGESDGVGEVAVGGEGFAVDRRDEVAGGEDLGGGTVGEDAVDRDAEGGNGDVKAESAFGDGGGDLAPST